MNRIFAEGAALVLLVFGVTVHAQKPGEPPDDFAWKKLMFQAMRAAGTKDFAQSEQLFRQAAKEAERFGVEDPRIATSLNSLGLVYRAEKKYSDAEAAYRRALVIMDASFGEGLDVANVAFNIAGVDLDQNRPADAIPNIRRTVAIYKRLLGDNSTKTGDALCIEGDAYRLTRQFREAEEPLRQCADIREKNVGIESPALADALYSLALTQTAEGKLSLAEPRFSMAEKIREKTSGLTSPLLAQMMEEHAAVLKSLGRGEESAKLSEMAAAIRRNSDKGK